MFFVRGLSLNGREVFVNPDQVLYVCKAGFRRHKTALVLTHHQRLIVDQDTQTVRLRFEEYLKDVAVNDEEDEPIGGLSVKSGQRPYLT